MFIMRDLKEMKQKSLLSKVPEVTLYFWIIKVLCTTVGETASDFLNVNLGFGLGGTSIVMGCLLLIALVFQFKAKKYIPGIYWLTVVLISIFGTLVTDNFTDKMGIPLEISTVAFTIALALTFSAWFAFEKTLSIHSIFTVRREMFYWLTILFTFALGTASGDLMAESLGLGYLVTGIIICAVVASVIIAWRVRLDSVLSFWIVYIMTRPLGASLGDYLSQTHSNGGLGLGATITSVLFISAILLTVLFLSITKRDLIAKTLTQNMPGTKPKNVFMQVAVVISVLIIAAGTGYHWRHAKLKAIMPAALSVATLHLGDLSDFRVITDDALNLVRTGKLPAAKSRIGDLEYAWDNAEAQLRPMNSEKWSKVDKSTDNVLRKLRSVHPDSAACSEALESLISVLDNIDNHNQETTTIVQGNTPALNIAVEKAKNMPLGDLTPFRIIAENSLTMVTKKEMPGARLRINDLEKSWDDAEQTLRPMNADVWTVVDKSIDRVLSELRSGTPDSAACLVALNGFIAKCQSLSK